MWFGHLHFSEHEKLQCPQLAKAIITEKQGECIRFLRSYYRPACKMSLYKIGIFGIILAALLMCDKEAIEA